MERIYRRTDAMLIAIYLKPIHRGIKRKLWFFRKCSALKVPLFMQKIQILGLRQAKRFLEHVQNAQIQIKLMHSQSLIQAFALH